MVLVLLFAIGAAVAAAGALVGRRGGRPVILPQAVVAILGAMLGGYVLADALGHEPSHPGDLDTVVLLAALIGAIALLTLFRLIERAVRFGVIDGRTS